MRYHIIEDLKTYITALLNFAFILRQCIYHWIYTYDLLTNFSVIIWVFEGLDGSFLKHVIFVGRGYV